MRWPRIPRLFRFKNYLNNCFAYDCPSTLLTNMLGPCIAWLFRFKNNLNNSPAYYCTRTLFSYMRGPRIPPAFRFKNYFCHTSTFFAYFDLLCELKVIVYRPAGKKILFCPLLISFVFYKKNEKNNTCVTKNMVCTKG